jgi:DNA-binding CsgD family transcriptional regulator
MALFAAHRGDAGRARSLAEEGVVAAEAAGTGIGSPIADWALAMLDLSLGDSEACARRLEPLLDASERAHVVDPGVNRYVPDLAEALIDLGRLEAADALLTTLERRARELERPSVQAAACRCRALLLAHGGALDPAIALLEEALELHARAPIPYDRARTLLALGGAQRRARQRRTARETLESALAIFEELGAAIWAAKARAELGRIGGRAPSADGLTPTEGRVAALVVEGKSNKEVAADLVLSVHTVEAALTSIYRKLDVRSRTEMAAKLAEHA